MAHTEVIERVERMERRFDALTAALRSPDALASPEVREDFAALSAYLSGAWLADYELDRRGALPPALKRGVLSQDALYELLCRADAMGVKE